MHSEVGLLDCHAEPADGPAPEIRRILVRLPNWVGDVVMATPVLRALRRRFPMAHIAAEGRPFLRGLLEGLSSVDEFIPDGGKGFGRQWRRRRVLRSAHFDCAVLLPDSVSAALGPALAGIPRRLGYARDAARRLLVTEAIDVPREGGVRVPISMPLRYGLITRRLGCQDAGLSTELPVDDEARQRVEARLDQHAVGAFAVVSPGANFGASKLYPPESFARACDLVHAHHGLSVVFAPGPGEEALARRIAELMRAEAVVLDEPVTTLQELVALTALARVALSNDTGPRHVAVALGVPVAVVMGPTDPRHTDYQMTAQRVLREDVECSPCHKKTCPIDHRCMTRLAPERVSQAVSELLAQEVVERPVAARGPDRSSPGAAVPASAGRDGRGAAS